jgi:hypothetical protein
MTSIYFVTACLKRKEKFGGLLFMEEEMELKMLNITVRARHERRNVAVS